VSELKEVYSAVWLPPVAQKVVGVGFAVEVLVTVFDIVITVVVGIFATL
jgi:hypothetical protein